MCSALPREYYRMTENNRPANNCIQSQKIIISMCSKSSIRLIRTIEKDHKSSTNFLILFHGAIDKCSVLTTHDNTFNASLVKCRCPLSLPPLQIIQKKTNDYFLIPQNILNIPYLKEWFLDGGNFLLGKHLNFYKKKVQLN